MQSAPVPPWITAADLARRCRVTERTARRWLSFGHMPAVHRLTLDIQATGELGLIHPRWTGWLLHQGALYAPGGARFDPGEILSIPIRVQLIGALECAVRELQAQVRDFGQLPLFSSPQRLAQQIAGADHGADQ